MEGDRQVYTTYVDGSTPDSIDFNFLNDSDRKGYSLKFGADYSINEHLLINGEINYDQHLHAGNNEQIYESYTKRIKENDFDNNYDLEGFFDINHTFDNQDQEFNFSISYDIEKDNEYENLLSVNLDTTALFQNMNTVEVDLSYKYPINDKSKMELGYDGKINANEETMDFQIENFNGKNTFSYDRSIHGIYLEYNHKVSEK